MNDIKVLLIYKDGYAVVLSLDESLSYIKEKTSYIKKNSYNSKRIMENNFPLTE